MTPSSSDLSEVPVHLVYEVLAWCRDHAGEERALVRFNELLGMTELQACFRRSEVGAEVVATARALVGAVLDNLSPGATVQAHMVILMAALLDFDCERDAVDALFVQWLRHPASYGSSRQTPPSFQRPAFVQRLADLLGWGQLHLDRDREAIARFLAWVNTWTPKRKQQVARTLAMLRRVFPDPSLWKMVRM